ncbi:protein-L-isoaspartate(D-aspartate) O-methyltransferase [Prosthecochloris sp. SCSIO W1103]|uniref:protein-L-isoaspartate(D-aspartate) O-methyltransferase n=1 Tax=Prosthecochloris sp. SCSIO W1103 TaxID=2992244 RepID=UPI00223E138C|nr:protein-L-isoaspartate(D-aspartate) O-methyltransferase [Prosthecochloris sp. SCSIO W1103]UZJ37323.1 protein-L-isoaspartate(D-aspartate) O-methyltransferase [Prosthecochloris sp. SCSIO W1103]
MAEEQDAHTYKKRRCEMVEQLRRYGINNSRVLDAFLSVERHLFFDLKDRDYAYDDCAFPIGCGQTISQPFTVAYMTSMLVERCSGGKVLEIGTGSGYQAAILDCIGYSVYTVERIPELFERSSGIFSLLGLNIRQCLGDGTLGWSDHAPYNGIIVTAGAPEPPHTLLAQLAGGGVMVIPVGNSAGQRMTVMTRRGDTFGREEFHTFVFVPLVGKEGWRDG